MIESNFFEKCNIIRYYHHESTVPNADNPSLSAEDLLPPSADQGVCDVVEIEKDTT
jgi:hypothetical protein